MISLLNSKLFSLVLLLAIAWLGFIILDVYTEKESVQRDVKDLEAKVEKLERDNTYLEKFITYIKDPAFLAREARARLNFRAADEQVAFVYRTEDLPASSSLQIATPSFFVKIKIWLYDMFR